MQSQWKTVFVVNDDESQREHILSLLRGKYPTIQGCSFSEIDENRLWKCSVLVVIIDRRTNETQFTQLVTLARREIPIVVTQSGSPLDLAKWVALGADDYLPDPFDLEIWAFRLEACFEKAQLKGGLTEYIRIVSSELSNPLVSIRGYLEVLRRKFDFTVTDEQRQEFFTIIHRNTIRASRILQNVRDMTMLENRLMQLVFTSFPLEPLCNEILDRYREQFSTKGQSLALSLPEKPINIEGDRIRLDCVLGVLLENANQYTPIGGHISIVAEHPNPLQPERKSPDIVRITVQDTGIGIAAEEHDLIFEAFKRSTDTRVWEQAGTGINLFVAKGIIELHGGRIWVESALNEGSRFHFTIPLSR